MQYALVSESYSPKVFYEENLSFRIDKTEFRLADLRSYKEFSKMKRLLDILVIRIARCSNQTWTVHQKGNRTMWNDIFIDVFEN